jgi:hypothetical protein
MGYGINQVATSLYCSALISDLEVVSRTAPAQYLNSDVMGLDAEIIWGSTDLKLRNNHSYPVQISASASNGSATVQILGTESRDYFIKLSHEVTDIHDPKIEYVYYTYEDSDGYQDGDVIQEGSSGYLIKTYKVKYDRKNAKELSRDFLTNSQYPAVDRIVARVEAPPETEAPTLPPTEPTTPPTETTAPPPETTEATQPPTEAPVAETQPEAVSDEAAK